jgi:rhodanese-related sulfurtransferase
MIRAMCLILFASLPGLSADSPALLRMSQVEALLGKPGVFIYDVNTPELWQQGHLPGAIYINEPKIRRFLPQDKNATLIFYCANRLCIGAEQAARQAMLFGYHQVFVMPEGIFGWAGSGRPIKRGSVPR